MSAAIVTTLKQDVRVISFIGLAHGLSHFYQLALAPLFPLLKTEFSVSYTQLGLLTGLFYAVSGICQTLAGFAVDRYGARQMLAFGLLLLGMSMILAGMASSYWILLPIAVLGGIGNSVFHPADLSLINASVEHKRLGYAYSVHAVGGNLGWAAAPIAVLALTAAFNWRTALVIIGILGIVMAMLVLRQKNVLQDHRRAQRVADTAAEAAGKATQNTWDILMSPPILLSFGYFALMAVTLIGLQTFAMQALISLFGVTLAVAASAVSSYLLGGAAGIILGGFVATHTTRHDLVAICGMLAASTLAGILAAGMVSNPMLVTWMILIGLVAGTVSPSRDMLIRKATPLRSSGKIYGFVYSGLDLGSAVSPILFGWFMDHNAPRLIFITVAFCFLLVIATVFQLRQSTAQA